MDSTHFVCLSAKYPSIQCGFRFWRAQSWHPNTCCWLHKSFASKIFLFIAFLSLIFFFFLSLLRVGFRQFSSRQWSIELARIFDKFYLILHYVLKHVTTRQQNIYLYIGQQQPKKEKKNRWNETNSTNHTDRKIRPKIEIPLCPCVCVCVWSTTKVKCS